MVKINDSSTSTLHSHINTSEAIGNCLINGVSKSVAWVKGPVGFSGETQNLTGKLFTGFKAVGRGAVFIAALPLTLPTAILGAIFKCVGVAYSKLTAPDITDETRIAVLKGRIEEKVRTALENEIKNNKEYIIKENFAGSNFLVEDRVFNIFKKLTSKESHTSYLHEPDNLKFEKYINENVEKYINELLIKIEIKPSHLGDKFANLNVITNYGLRFNDTTKEFEEEYRNENVHKDRPTFPDSGYPIDVRKKLQ